MSQSTQPRLKFASRKQLWSAIRSAKEAAKEDAKNPEFPYLKSRGIMIGTCDANREQCDPYPHAEAVEWDGSWIGLRELAQEIEQRHTSVDQIVIFGGFDSAESREDYLRDNYEPWASEWSVVVWKR